MSFAFNPNTHAQSWELKRRHIYSMAIGSSMLYPNGTKDISGWFGAGYSIPFGMTVDSDCTIFMHLHNLSNWDPTKIPSLIYSVDNMRTWQTFPIVATDEVTAGTGEKVHLSAGTRIYLRAAEMFDKPDGIHDNDRFAMDGQIIVDENGNPIENPCLTYCNFVIESNNANCTVTLGGNILSLCYNTWPTNGTIVAPALFNDAAVFGRLFYQCKYIRNLNGLTLPSNGAYTNALMFEACPHLTDASGLKLDINSVASTGCFYGLFKNCTALQHPVCRCGSTRNSAENCFRRMYYGCSALNFTLDEVNTLKSNNGGLLNRIGAKALYYEMFKNCSSLNPPGIINIVSNSYAYQYESMFENCTALVHAPIASNETAEVYAGNADNCFKNFCRGCKALTSVTPTIPSSTTPCTPTALKYFNKFAYDGMFADCPKLSLVELRIDSIGYVVQNRACAEMFQNSGNDGKGITLGHETRSGNTHNYVGLSISISNGVLSVEPEAFRNMFKGAKVSGSCTITINTDLKQGALEGMFDGTIFTKRFSNLESTRFNYDNSSFVMLNFTNTKFSEICCANMFANSTVTCIQNSSSNFTGRVGLNMTSTQGIGAGAFYQMFYNCPLLTDISSSAIFPTGELKAPTGYITLGAFEGMFNRCVELSTISSTTLLHATLLVTSKNCYKDMFRGCTKLTNINSVINGNIHPSFPLSDGLQYVPEGCFRSMFQESGIVSITPYFFASMHRQQGYFGADCLRDMFYNCKSLTSPISFDYIYTTVINIKYSTTCMHQLFYGCTKLVGSTFYLPYSINGSVSIGSACSNMFSGIGSMQATPTAYGTTYTIN